MSKSNDRVLGHQGIYFRAFILMSEKKKKQRTEVILYSPGMSPRSGNLPPMTSFSSTVRCNLSSVVPAALRAKQLYEPSSALVT
jgi:hypothetical protein